MAVWLVRAGKSGEYEEKFLSDNRVYATWQGLRRDLGALTEKKQLQGVLHEFYPDWGSKRVINYYASQLWPFAKEMKPGDLVVTPRKRKAAIAVGEIKGDYKFDDKADDPYFHSRAVKWLAQEVPRSVFDQDLLFSFGAFMTICEIRRNDAEGRLRAMARSGCKGEGIASAAGLAVSEEDTDLEELARGQIAKLISRKFRGHDLERLVEALLQAQGYTTYLSPVGADKGGDILAAPGPLGFGSPRICVQVKSSSSPIEHAILNQLKGAMQPGQTEGGAGQRQPPVGREHRDRGAPRRLEHVQELSGPRIPEPGRLIHAAGQHARSIGRQGPGLDGGTLQERVFLLPRQALGSLPRLEELGPSLVVLFDRAGAVRAHQPPSRRREVEHRAG